MTIHFLFLHAAVILNIVLYYCNIVILYFLCHLTSRIHTLHGKGYAFTLSVVTFVSRGKDIS